jgi:hypothetical protein
MPFVSFPERYGFQIGFKKGFAEGRQEGLLAAIPVILEWKFGEDGLALMPAIRQQGDVTLLRAILDAIRTAPDAEAVRRLLPTAPGENVQTEESE